MSLNKHYIISNKEAIDSKLFDLENFVLHKGSQDFIHETYRKLVQRAKSKGMDVKSGIDELGRVWAEFSNSYKKIKIWVCDYNQAKPLMLGQEF